MLRAPNTGFEFSFIRSRTPRRIYMAYNETPMKGNVMEIEKYRGLTVEDITNNYNTIKGKKLMKKYIIHLAITTVAVAGIAVIANKLESKNDSDED
jgi:hypothetical protein